MKGQFGSFRNEAITILMAYTIKLEPLNIFLYTWRFLTTLEREEKNRILKKFYRWVARLTIVIVPLAYYGIFSAYVVEFAKYFHYYFNGEFKKADKYLRPVNALE